MAISCEGYPRESIVIDRKVVKDLHEAKYQIWKRCNILELHELYEMDELVYKENFERFCRRLLENLTRLTQI